MVPAVFAQIPDTKIKIDATLHYRAPNGGQPVLRWYDTFGRSSVGILDMSLEPGYQLHVSQRFQKIAGNSDPDFFEEAFIEDRGLWRMGKQILPFGAKNLIRESAYALTGETTLLLNGVPIVASLFDNGSGRARGVVARFGGRLGFSAALGDYLSTQATSLTYLREPEKSPGTYRGYSLMLGTDYSKKIRGVQLGVELVSLSKGQTSLDKDSFFSDLSLTYKTRGLGNYRLSWTREWNQSSNAIVGRSTFLLMQNLWLEPYARLRQGRISDAGFSLRLAF